MLTFTDDEKALISTLSIVGGWDDESDSSRALKRKIKDFYLAAGDLCCYCLRDMRGWHRMSIDLEHVLPKSVYPQLMFEPRNLNLACKRCNMRIKGERVCFFVGTPQSAADFLASEYSFIHPNLDKFEDHISIFTVQYNRKLLVKYTVTDGSTKGAQTYEFFRLRELERDSYDEAQGNARVEPSERMPASIAREVMAILSSIE